jgi:hypothetical protein
MSRPNSIALLNIRSNNTGLVSALVLAMLLPETIARPLETKGSSVRAARPGAETLVFTVNTSQTFPISRYIYGANFAFGETAAQGQAPWYGLNLPPEITLNRLGGNRFTTYNWETNYSNAASDLKYQNDDYLSSSTEPGAAIRSRAVATFAKGAALMVTVPLIGYVAADKNGPTDTLDETRARRLATRFKISSPFKTGRLTLKPDAEDRVVYQDEFVNWVDKTFPGTTKAGARTPIFFSLDNEPDSWTGTHKEIQGKILDQYPRLLTYDGFIGVTIDYARAVKSVTPQALVFGPALATWAGFATLGRYPSPDPVYGTQFFLDVYLDKLRAAERTYGRRLVDVLDLHWYPAAGTRAGEITNDYAPQSHEMIEARLQAPRTLWDSTYDEGSWVSGAAVGKVRLFPRLREEIAAHYPGTKIAITEYYFGRGGDISGGLAQADVLGIFGREGVFAATLWPQAGIWAKPYLGSGEKAYAYIFGALKMFRNYDGAGGQFGDTGVRASTSDAVTSSVYASLDQTGRVVLVILNKSDVARDAVISVRHPAPLGSARIFTLTDGNPRPMPAGTVAVGPNNRLQYRLPPSSVSTIVLSNGGGR